MDVFEPLPPSSKLYLLSEIKKLIIEDSWRGFQFIIKISKKIIESAYSQYEKGRAIALKTPILILVFFTFHTSDITFIDYAFIKSWF